MAVSKADRIIEQARRDVVERAREWHTHHRQMGVLNDPLAYTAKENALRHAIDHLETIEQSISTSVPTGTRDTSKAAAKLPMLGSVRHDILCFILDTGATSDVELEDALNGSHQTVSAARSHLTTIGLLMDSGLRFQTMKRGRDGSLVPAEHIRWDLTPTARHLLEQEAAHAG